MFPREGGREGGRAEGRQTDGASCREDKFSERANVEEGERGALAGDGNLVGLCRMYPLRYGNSCNRVTVKVVLLTPQLRLRISIRSMY